MRKILTCMVLLFVIALPNHSISASLKPANTLSSYPEGSISGADVVNSSSSTVYRYYTGGDPIPAGAYWDLNGVNLGEVYGYYIDIPASTFTQTGYQYISVIYPDEDNILRFYAYKLIYVN